LPPDDGRWHGTPSVCHVHERADDGVGYADVLQEQDGAPRLAHPAQLPQARHWVRHRAEDEGRYRPVKGPVGKGQGLRGHLGKIDVRVALPCTGGGPLKHSGSQVHRRHASTCRIVGHVLSYSHTHLEPTATCNPAPQQPPPAGEGAGLSQILRLSGILRGQNYCILNYLCQQIDVSIS
jgi:hypothetical protein